MSQNRPLLARFLIMGAFAGVIGGLLLSGPWGHAAEPLATRTAPASPEMIQLLRDEHGLVTNMLKAQLVAEREELATQAAVRGADGERTIAAIAPRRAIAAR